MSVNKIRPVCKTIVLNLRPSIYCGTVNKKQDGGLSGFENKMRKELLGTIDSNGCGNSEPIPIRKHVADSQMSSILDRRHLEDVTNQQESQQSPQNMSNRSRDSNQTLIIDDTLVKLDPVRLHRNDL